MKRLMVKIILSATVITAMLFISHLAEGQGNTIKNPGQFLFSEFTTARVAIKVGKDLTMLANYNIVTEMIVFLQKGQVYDLIDYHMVDTIYFKDHTFIPGEKVFYEVSVSGPVSLLIRHSGTIQGPPKPAAYGGTSEVSSSNYVSNLKLGNNVYRLQADTALIIKQNEEFLISKDAVITPFHSEKQFLSLLPENKSELKSYIKKNKVHFDNEAEVTELVKYCNGLKK
jgi:hypothetical protein